MKAKCNEINADFLLIETEDREFFEIPKFLYENYEITKGAELIGVKKYDKKRKIDIFEPKHPKYAINETLEFPIVDFISYYNKNYFIVEDCFKNRIRVHALKWQEGKGEKNKLLCHIFDIKSGKPLLRNVDYYHPIYKVGKEYDFEFIGFEKKTLKDGRPFDVIKLKGQDGCLHETPPLPSQFGHKFKPKSIKCKIIEITSYLKLEQTSVVDLYFAKIEDIVSAEASVIQKYFFELENKDECTELFKQYQSSSSLWTITYCNKILPEIIMSFANRFDFKEAIIVTDLLLEIENWILKSGLLDSFKKEETKTQIKIKSERFIEKFRLMKITFNCILSNNLELSKITTNKEKTIALAYYLRFNKKELIDYSRLFEWILEVINKNKTEDAGKFEIGFLTSHIEYQKNQLFDKEIETDFTIGNFSKLPFLSHDDLNLHLKYTILQAYLSEKSTKANLYLGEFYKYLSFHYVADLDKKNSLKQSYQLIKSKKCCADFKIEYLTNLNDLEYISNSIWSSLSDLQINPEKEKWIGISRKFKDNETTPVHLKQKTVFGYTGIHDGIFCILPNSNIDSSTLKHFTEKECNILINATIQDTFYNFNTIIIKELPKGHKEHKIQNVLIKELNIGDVLNARVKSIANYGVFLSTFAGEGLLHIQNISDLFIDIPLKELFKLGEELNVCVLDIKEGDKLDFGLKQLHGTEYSDDLNEIEFRIFSPGLHVNIPTESSSVDVNTELNKQLYLQGHLFEYFSNLQYDFEGKIKYLKLAKVYYSGIQSSRSYFLNIYIAYFEILMHIERVLDDKSFALLGTTLEKSESLLSQLEKNTKSIEKFPSIYKLLFFLDIIRQFNNTTIASIRKLSNYLLDEKYVEYKTLNKVAKVVLSNNLISSESEDKDFVFKNLRILYQYLKDGVFDLSENEHEQKERELKERIAHIRNKIFNEESEKVEFKSSLIKPVLDSGRNKRLSDLLKKKDSESKNEIDNLIGKPAKNRVIHSAMKTLVAFANSKGGTLYIGINDDGEFIGLINDYEEIGQSSRDELGKKLDDLIKDYIGNSFFGLVSIQFESIDKKDILIIEVNPTEDEVFLIKDENKTTCSDFYIRRHSSSVKLSGKELIDYFKWRFNNPSA